MNHYRATYPWVMPGWGDLTGAVMSTVNVSNVKNTLVARVIFSFAPAYCHDVRWLFRTVNRVSRRFVDLKRTS